MTNDNTPAFPVFPETSAGHASAFTGMTLRDYFAAKASSDELQEMQFRHLSITAQEHISGMKSPAKITDSDSWTTRIAWQIAVFEFECAVKAAIRYKMADAMMEARKV